jgi:hypothetical protein
MPDAVVRVAEVKGLRTKSGKTRFVLRDEHGREYTTFREEVAREALVAEGRRARITFHEQERGQYVNVYLDSVEVVDEDAPAAQERGEPVEEAAWKTALDAAPWLLGGEPEEPVPPDELFERLQPFKERVAEDIRAADAEE